MSAAGNEAIGRLFFAEQDRLKGGPSDELCAPGYTAELNAFPILDYNGHHSFSVGFYGAFPDLHHIIEDTVADEERVAVRFRLNGTHWGEFMGLEASGKAMNIVATAILAVSDGKVTSLRAIFDQATMLQQITSE